MGKKAGEWTRKIEISKEEIPGSKRSMCGYIMTYSRGDRPTDMFGAGTSHYVTNCDSDNAGGQTNNRVLSWDWP